MTKFQIAGVAVATALAGVAGGYALRGTKPSIPVAVAVDPDKKAAAVPAKAVPRAGRIAVTPEQMRVSGIAVAAVTEGSAGGEVSASGQIAARTDAVARVTARTSGVVVRLLRQLGDPVGVGTPLALLDSREIAGAQAALLKARSAAELARTTLAREDTLFRQKVTARADFDQARAAYAAARIDVDLAAQSLRALGAPEGGGGSDLRFIAVRSPIAGQVISIGAAPGDYVAAERELYQVADRHALQADVQIAARDLARIRVGQRALISVADGGAPIGGRVQFLSPGIDPATGAARAILALPDARGFAVGQSVTARIVSNTGGAPVAIVPREAVQEIDERSSVFVAVPGGFAIRPVELGQGSSDQVPVIAGVRVGERIAVANSFVLKAQLGKGSEGDEEGK